MRKKRYKFECQMGVNIITREDLHVHVFYGFLEECIMI